MRLTITEEDQSHLVFFWEGNVGVCMCLFGVQISSWIGTSYCCCLLNYACVVFLRVLFNLSGRVFFCLSIIIMCLPFHFFFFPLNGLVS